MASSGTPEGLDEKRLYGAAAKGDTEYLHELLRDDPFLVDRVSHMSPNKTPLHVATNKGHLDFVKEILKLNPQLAEDLDSQKSSALHIASARGHFDIVRVLLSAAPETCLARDSLGRNPVHIAVIKGHVGILKELIQEVPLAAREKIDGGSTVLHLCVKHDKLEALKILVPHLVRMIDAKDDDGETILHMAARNNHLKIIEYLITDTEIDTNIGNSSGETAEDIFCKGLSDSETSDNLLRRLVRRYKSTRTREAVKSLSRKQGAVMVVAVLIATMAFQAGISPPGGVWQEDYIVDSNGNPVPNPHRAGESVIAYYNKGNGYKIYVFANTLAFSSSLFAIYILTLELRSQNDALVLRTILMVMASSIFTSYCASHLLVTPETKKKQVSYVYLFSFLVCSFLVVVAWWRIGLRIFLRKRASFRRSAEVVNVEANQDSTV